MRLLDKIPSSIVSRGASGCAGQAAYLLQSLTLQSLVRGHTSIVRGHAIVRPGLVPICKGAVYVRAAQNTEQGAGERRTKLVRGRTEKSTYLQRSCDYHQLLTGLPLSACCMLPLLQFGTSSRTQQH